MNSLRNIPSVHELLTHSDIKPWAQNFSRDSVTMLIRTQLKIIRKEIVKGRSFWTPETIRLQIKNAIHGLHTSQFRRVINATGIIIHTNLGRAPLSENALQKMLEIGRGYSTIEYDLKKGKRGERNDHIEELLCHLTGAEEALVVNNNAAAVVLALNSMAFGKEVIVSRGELVEIGNSFRLPDIMEKSGVTLRETGTTNKTKLKDYEKAISKNTALFLKIHTSNFEMVGFTETAPLKELVGLSRHRSIPLLFDAGSGLLGAWPWGGVFEPHIGQLIKEKVDIVTFSGDKLLGGPQAGFIVGGKKYLRLMKRNPLYRALRIDKMMLSGVEETLRHYLKKEQITKIPFYKMLTVSINDLEKKAEMLIQKLMPNLSHIGKLKIIKGVSKIGGGAFPLLEIPTILISLSLNRSHSISLYENKLRFPVDQTAMPIIARIQNNTILFDLRTIAESEYSNFVKTVQQQ